jgi:hypothetical protein
MWSCLCSNDIYIFQYVLIKYMFVVFLFSYYIFSVFLYILIGIYKCSYQLCTCSYYNTNIRFVFVVF